MQDQLTHRDKHLRDLVQKQLEWEPSLDCQDISVSAKDGTVILAGFAHSYLDKFVAARTAR